VSAFVAGIDAKRTTELAARKIDDAHENDNGFLR
jgi:hypothetical protein